MADGPSGSRHSDMWPPLSQSSSSSLSSSDDQLPHHGGSQRPLPELPGTHGTSKAAQSAVFNSNDDEDDDADDDDDMDIEEERRQTFVSQNAVPNSLPNTKGISLDRLTKISSEFVPAVGRLLKVPVTHRHASPAWDSKHVRMPFADPSSHGSKRWSRITESLGNIRHTISDIAHFNLLKELILDYNPSYLDRWNFESLEYFIQKKTPHEQWQLLETLDRMGKLAARLPHICAEPIPLLRKIGRTDRESQTALTLSREQIACLLANAFFCTFPMRNQKPTRHQHGKSDVLPLPTINFSSLFKHVKSIEAQTSKLQCVLNYFHRVSADQKLSSECVTFERRSVPKSREVHWDRSEAPFTNLRASSQGGIEREGAGFLQVDFANKLVGGGVLGRGCVQEEITFLAFTEMIVSRLFTEELGDHEVLVITGCQQYNEHYGYSYQFRWKSDFIDTTPSDHHGRRLAQVVCMDAKKYYDTRSQFNPDDIRRELNKAYCGFFRDSPPGARPLPAVATGNWGCGDFRGNRELKSLVQLMAAAEAKRDVCYFTFRDAQFVDDLVDMRDLISSLHLSVGDVCSMMEQYSRRVARHPSTSSELPDAGLFAYIRSTYGPVPGPGTRL